MKLYLILSKSNRKLVPKSDIPALNPEHRDYHVPMIERDVVLIKAMLRPDENTPKGSRCMILQAEGLDEVNDFVQRNPLVRYGAMEWTIQELLPNDGTDSVRKWFKGKFSAGHQYQAPSRTSDSNSEELSSEIVSVRDKPPASE
jgi:hypothetical protein